MSPGKYFLALDIGGTNVRTALAQGNRIVATRSERWPQNLSPGEDLDFVTELALKLLGEGNLFGKVGAAGVSLAALVDQNGTVVQWPNRQSWRGLPFRSLLEKRLSLPLIVEDDANAAALGEATFGAGQNYRHLMVMTVGTGVGAGIILNRRLFRGQHGWAGEIGHLTVLPDGPDCPCGKRGCLQLMASGRGLERIAIKQNLTGSEDVTAAAERAEKWAVESIAASGRWVGLAAANVVNLLDLEAVIIGGGLSGLGPEWWNPLEETMRANLINADCRSVALRRTALSDASALFGAILLAQQAFEGGA